jgi:threonine dehydratase
MQEKAKLRGKRVGLILTGGNIDFNLFQKWIAGNEGATTAARAMV